MSKGTSKMLFTEKEIELMKSIGLDCDFQNLDEDYDYWADIEEKVGDALVMHGFDENYVANDYGWICEGIIDKIPK